MSFPLLVAFALVSSQTEPVALLQVDGEQATFQVAVVQNQSNGYEVSIDCRARCIRPVSYREPVSDSPLGLFTRDQDGLVFSLWSGGSAYRVRVWRVSDAGVTKVGELSSRGRPDFLTERDGVAAIRIYESESGAGPLRPTLWAYRNGRFMRIRPSVR